MPKIRVLILSHMYPRKKNHKYGIFIHNQAKHLLKEECEIRVISPVHYSPKNLFANVKSINFQRPSKQMILDGIYVYYLRYIATPWKWFSAVSNYTMYRGIIWRFGSLINDFKPDLIHAYNATPDGFVALKIAKKYSLPLVCSLRGSDINVSPTYSEYIYKLTKMVLLEATMITSVSNDLKVAAEKIAKPEKEIEVVYNGCDTNIFRFNEVTRLQYRKKLGILPKDRVIIFVGRLLKTKGIFDLLKAFLQLRRNFSDLHLVLVGDGPETKSINNMISANGLKRKAHIIGEQLHNEIPNLLSSSDLFVLPTYYEGLPNSLLEAMACGLPIIITKVGGIPEAVIDGKNGILINTNDVHALVKAVEHLLRNERERTKMGFSGKDTIEKNFSWKRSANKLFNIYQAALEQK